MYWIFCVYFNNWSEICCFLNHAHFNTTLFHTQRPGLLACFMYYIKIDRIFHLCETLNLFTFEIINFDAQIANRHWRFYSQISPLHCSNHIAKNFVQVLNRVATSLAYFVTCGGRQPATNRTRSSLFVTYRNFSLLSVIVRVSIVLKRTVVVDNDWRFDNLSGSHLQSHVNCGSSVDGIYASDCCCHWSV